MNMQGTIVGYDPGGNNSHGLAIIRYESNKISHVYVSTHSTAQSVIDKIFEFSDVIGIGVDTLTCWSTGHSGWRPADRWLRERYTTIQNSIASANSLFGSMGLNGMSVLLELKARFPSICISEAHPKVVYYEMSKKKYEYSKYNLEMDSMVNDLFGIQISTKNDHEWDALISAYTVLSGMSGLWSKDLHKLNLQHNEKLIDPCGKTNYWWPD